MEPSNFRTSRYSAAQASEPNNPETVFTGFASSIRGQQFSSSIVPRRSLNSRSMTSSLQASRVSKLSSRLMSDSISDGALSSAHARKTSALTDVRLSAMVTNIDSRIQMINETIDQFKTECANIEDVIIERFKRLSTPEILDGSNERFESETERYVVLLDATKLTLQFIEQAKKSVLDFDKKGLNIDSEATLDVIEMIFKVRREEISLIGNQFELIERFENHQLNQFMQIRKMELEEQTLMFKQLKELAEFQSNERQLEHDRESKNRAQSFQETVDLKRVSIEERVARRKLDQEEKKQQQEHEIEDRKLNFEEEKLRLELAFKTTQEKIKTDLEKRRQKLDAENERLKIAADERARKAEADAEARVGVAQAAASASRCSIM